MIEARNLVKRYGNNTALHGVSFTFEKDCIYGFLGPNGAGKSTTMNIITGCIAANEGEVSVNGYDIFEDEYEAKRCIGYLPEQPPLYTDMTPVEYLTYVAGAKGISKKEITSEVTRVIEATHIGDVKGRLIKNLSKGYKQRVGIAQAILGDPEIIILDEPTVGLDPKQIIEIRELIRSLREGHTVILSSHILTEISEVCDYALIISEGNVVASDTIENLTKLFDGSNFVDLDVRGNISKVEDVIKAFVNIKSSEIYQKGAGVVHVRLSTPRDVDLRDELFFAFADAKLPIIAMVHEEVSLERVFLSLTQTKNEDHEKAEESLDGAESTEEDTDDGEYEPLFGSNDGGDE